MGGDAIEQRLAQLWDVAQAELARSQAANDAADELAFTLEYRDATTALCEEESDARTALLLTHLQQAHRHCTSLRAEQEKKEATITKLRKNLQDQKQKEKERAKEEKERLKEEKQGEKERQKQQKRHKEEEEERCRQLEQGRAEAEAAAAEAREKQREAEEETERLRQRHKEEEEGRAKEAKEVQRQREKEKEQERAERAKERERARRKEKEAEDREKEREREKEKEKEKVRQKEAERERVRQKEAEEARPAAPSAERIPPVTAAPTQQLVADSPFVGRRKRKYRDVSQAPSLLDGSRRRTKWKFEDDECIAETPFTAKRDISRARGRDVSIAPPTLHLEPPAPLRELSRNKSLDAAPKRKPRSHSEIPRTKGFSLNIAATSASVAPEDAERKRRRVIPKINLMDLTFSPLKLD